AASSAGHTPGAPAAAGAAGAGGGYRNVPPRAASSRRTGPNEGQYAGQRRSSKPWSHGGMAPPNAYHKNAGAGPRPGSPSEGDTADRHMYDRLLYLLIRSVGSNVVVTVKSGARFAGVLSSANTQSDLGVALRFAKRISPAWGDDPAADGDDGAKVFGTLVIPPKDLLDIEILAVNVSVAPNAAVGFKTDTDISRGNAEAAAPRELQPWRPDDGDAGQALEDLSLGNPHEAWDQFAVNEAKFGVQSSFDEDLYTTKLDRSHPLYKQREAAAERIAREIESSAHGGNIHLAEERNAAIDDSGVDEEDKYSGVARSVKQALNLPVASKYAPPAVRQKMADQHRHHQHLQQSHEATPASQLDSAIIMSQIKKPESKKPSAAAAPFRPANPGAYSLPASATTPGRKDELPARAAAATPFTPAAAHTPSSPASAPRAGSPQKSPEIEQALNSTFKQFVYGEKERLMQKKMEIYKKEKDGRLHDLMEFSQSFKLNTPVPMDLVPILAKDKSKQDEIIQKSAQNAKQPNGKQPVSPAPTSAEIPNATLHKQRRQAAARTSQPPPGQGLSARLQGLQGREGPAEAPSPTPLPAVVRKDAGSPKRLNINAHEFKPNPAAATFTPTFGETPSPAPAAKAAAKPAPAAAAPPPAPAPAAPPARAASKSSSRSASPSAFFASARSVPPQPRKKIKAGFNPFVRAKAAYKGAEPFVISKAYACPPTWTYADAKPYAELFVQPDQAEFQRIYGLPLPGTPMPVFSPRGGNVAMAPGSSSPMASSGLPQPFPVPAAHFDDQIRPLMPSSPPAMSPSMAPQMVPFNMNFMYAQQQYAQQYPYATRPGMTPGFIGTMPQQFLPHQQFPGQYMPQPPASSGQGFPSPGRNAHAAMMVPSASQQGFQSGYYGQPQ
ncbi:uncharacterized protein V1510DRAFT_354786, partial [Dipodascopsis tothii]|uniref:uncharacterized protein n=1 Tax=Dipodascopsis tothii TaxID=44089 RepID=UPI0034CDC949